MISTASVAWSSSGVGFWVFCSDWDFGCSLGGVLWVRDALTRISGAPPGPGLLLWGCAMGQGCSDWGFGCSFGEVPWVRAALTVVLGMSHGSGLL